MQTDSHLFPLSQFQTWRRPGLSRGSESKFIVTNENPSSGQVITRLTHLDPSHGSKLSYTDSPLPLVEVPQPVRLWDLKIKIMLT